MEVHHHSSTAHKWTHYLWEFMMLFLAVFLGFLAENQREHIVEKKRAKEYARTLLLDLKKDTAELDRAALFETMTNKMIDSLIDLEKSPQFTGNTALFYYYMRLASWSYTIDWNESSVSQMIYSGNLRYFNDPQLVNMISSYRTTSKTIATLEESIDASLRRSAPFRDQILKAEYVQIFSGLTMDDIIDGTNGGFVDSIRHINVTLNSNDRNIMNLHANALLATRGNRRLMIRSFYSRAKSQAKDIIELLKKEYHFKEAM